MLIQKFILYWSLFLILQLLYLGGNASNIDSVFQELRNNTELDRAKKIDCITQLNNYCWYSVNRVLNLDKAYIYNELALNVINKYNLDEKLGETFIIRGRINESKGFYNSALYDYYEVHKLREKENDTIKLSFALRLLGKCHRLLGDNQISLKYLNEALKLGVTHQSHRVYLLHQIAHTYMALDSLEKVQIHINTARSLAECENLVLAANLDLQANLFYKQKEYNKCLKTYLTIDSILQNDVSPSHLSRMYLIQGKAWAKLGNVKSAVLNLDKCAQISKNYNYYERYFEAQKGIQTLYANEGNINKAYALSVQLDKEEYEFGKKSADQISRDHSNLQKITLKGVEIRRLQTENDIKENELEQNEKTTKMLFTISFLLLAILFFAIKNNKNRLKYSKKIESKNRELKDAKIKELEAIQESTLYQGILQGQENERNRNLKTCMMA